MTKRQKQERDEAIAELRKWLKPGDTVHTILRHVSRSGMQREISPIIHDADGPNDVGYLAAPALGDRIGNKHGGIIMGGCGMDMGFALVYNLSHVLFPEGFGCIGERCPSNDHPNGDRSYRRHNEGKEDPAGSAHWHRDGGYALRHRWL